MDKSWTGNWRNIMKIYRGHLIEKTLTGWYTCFIVGSGTLKADTLAGIKQLITDYERTNPKSD